MRRIVKRNSVKNPNGVYFEEKIDYEVIVFQFDEGENRKATNYCSVVNQCSKKIVLINFFYLSIRKGISGVTCS